MVKLEDLHKFAIKEGKKKDPRTEDQIEKQLKKRKENYEELEGVKKEMYDEDRLENPFDDTKIVHGPEREVNNVAIGIDMEIPELLLIEKLNEKGKNIDSVISHHPEGRAMARLYEVMGLQVDVLSEGGIPVSQAEALVKPRTEEVKKSVHPANHPRTPKAAKLLDIPFMTLHTAADNHAYSFIKKYLEEEEPKTLNEIIDSLLELPEYKWSLKYGMEPQIHTGNSENRSGEIGVFGFTGGTDLGEEVIEKMVNSGVDTLVAMHAPKDQIEKADEHNINIITAGHMPSDSVGINIFLDKAQKEFELDISELSGFKRVKRI